MFYYGYITILNYCVLLPIQFYYLITVNIIIIPWSYMIIVNFLIILNLIIPFLPHTQIYNTHNVYKEGIITNRILFIYFLLLIYIVISNIFFITTLVNTNNNNNYCLISYALSIIWNSIIIINFTTKKETKSTEFDLLHMIPIITKVVSNSQLEKMVLLDCSICLELFKKYDSVSCISCKHYFHTDCIIRWHNVKLNCPLCREIAKPYYWI